MSFFKSLSFLVSTLFFIACSGSPQIARQGPPKWIDVPPSDGKIYGIGQASYNYYGVNAQKQEAMAQAIDMIARQKGVKVENSLERIKRVDKGQVSRASSIGYSFQTVNGTTVNAKIQDVYHDKYKDVYHILMIEY